MALENLDVLKQNGFELDVHEDGPPGQRVHLLAQPMSKGTVFDTKGAVLFSRCDCRCLLQCA